MSKKIIELIISNSDIVNENILTGYYRFHIEVIYDKKDNNINDSKIIKRRYKEIEWLYNCLLKEELGCKILDFPEKDILANITLRIINTTSIDERKKYFQALLNYILNHKYLSKNANFEKFLKEQDLIVDNDRDLNNDTLVSKTYSVINNGFNYLFSGKK